MSAENVVAGYTQTVEINGTRFPQVGCSYSIQRSTFNNRDDLAGRYQKSKVDGEQFRATIDFQLATDLNPHETPFFVLNDNVDTIHLKGFPRGFAFDPYDIPEFTITDFQQRGNPQSGPVAGSFSGESYGEFTKPGDALLS